MGKFGLEMSCSQDFSTPRLLSLMQRIEKFTAKFIVEKLMVEPFIEENFVVEKFSVEKFRVEKSGVKRSRVETWG